MGTLCRVDSCFLAIRDSVDEIVSDVNRSMVGTKKKASASISGYIILWRSDVFHARGYGLF